MQVRGLLVGCVVAALLLGSVASAEEPITLDEMRALRKERKRPHEILKIVEERGLAFSIDRPTERKLKYLGFSRRQLTQLKDIADRQAEDTLNDAEPSGPEKRRDEALEENGQDLGLDPPQTEEEGDRPTDPFVRIVDKEIKQIIEKSGTGVETEEGKHTRLIGKRKLLTKYIPVVKRWEEKAEKRFPDPLGGQIDRRGVNIALFESKYHYQRWVQAMFQVFEEEGVEFNDPDPAKRAMKTSSFFVRGIFSAYIADDSPEVINHRIVFGSAYMGILQLSQDNIPDALATGFGNLAETMMFNDQFITVQSGYIDRDLKRDRKTWPERVQSQFKLNKIASIQNVLAYTTRSMQLPQYAEGWSLLSLLAQDEDKLVQLVGRFAKNEDAYEALSEVYEIDDQKLLKRWRRYARAQR